MTRVLMDASNLKAGGGLQVAGSLIDEVAGLVIAGGSPAMQWINALDVLVSPAVSLQLDRAAKEALNIQVDSTDVRNLLYPMPNPEYDVTFVVFGPRYQRRRTKALVQGYADVTSLYPRPEPLEPLPFVPLVKHAVRAKLSRRIAEKSDALVVETEAMRRRCINVIGLPPERVHVVPNTVNGVFFRPDRWKPLSTVPNVDVEHLICYVGRNYPHKNLAFLAPVGELLAKSGLSFRFALTLRDDEWHSLPAGVRKHSQNFGELSVEELPMLYTASSAAIFPSLLEAFSAMPLEAMLMQVPLVAGNVDFVRDVCGAAVPYYYDPGDPISCADAVHLALKSDPGRDARLLVGRDLVCGLPSARERAEAVLNILEMAVASGAR